MPSDRFIESFGMGRRRGDGVRGGSAGLADMSAGAGDVRTGMDGLQATGLLKADESTV